MEIFYLNLISVFFYYIIIKLIFKNKQQRDKIFIRILFLQLLMILALRDPYTGTDMRRYMELYDLSEGYSLSYIIDVYDKEIGISILNKIIQFFTSSKQIYIGVIAFITLIGPYKFIKNNSHNILISIIMYITFEHYTFLFSGLRQGIALSIVLVGFEYLKRKENKKYIMCVLLASTFHQTALIALLSIPLKNIRISDKNLIISISILLGCFILKGFIVSLLMRMFYTEYSQMNNGGGGYTILLLYLILLASGYIFCKNYIVNSQEGRMYYLMMIVGCIIQVFASIEGNIFRLTLYFTIALVLYIPLLCESIKDFQTKVVIKYGILCICLVKYIMMLDSSLLISEYKFFWR